MLTLEQASRLYGVPLTDYGERRGQGLLVSSGSGLMMAVMDACPAFRWCVDLDTLRSRQDTRIGDFLQMAERLTEPIAICGWFSISNPAPLKAAAAGMTTSPIVYAGNVRLGIARECESLEEFLRAVREHPIRESHGQAEQV